MKTILSPKNSNSIPLFFSHPRAPFYSSMSSSLFVELPSLAILTLIVIHVTLRYYSGVHCLNVFCVPEFMCHLAVESPALILCTLPYNAEEKDFDLVLWLLSQ